MKQLKQLLFFGFAVTFILSSCSMDKRVYTSGYYIEWKNSRSNDNKQEIAINNIGKSKKAIPDNENKGVGITGDIEEKNDMDAIQGDLIASTEKTVPLGKMKKQFFILKTTPEIQKQEKEKIMNKISKRFSNINKRSLVKDGDGGSFKNKLYLILGILAILLLILLATVDPFSKLGLLITGIALVVGTIVVAVLWLTNW